MLEKHYKTVVHRSICDYFFDAQKKSASPEDLPPVIATPHHYLFVYHQNGLYFIAVTVQECELLNQSIANPSTKLLMALHLLQRFLL